MKKLKTLNAMRKFDFVFLCTLAFVSNSIAEKGIDKNLPPINPETENADFLNQQWYLGHKKEIFTVINARLKFDENDLIALLVLLDYEGSDANWEAIPDIVNKIEENLNQISGSKIFNDLLLNIKIMKIGIEKMPEDAKVKDKSKLHINGKQLSTIDYIRSLEKKNKFRALTKLEMDYIEGKIGEEELKSGGTKEAGGNDTKDTGYNENISPKNSTLFAVDCGDTSSLFILIGGTCVILIGGVFLWRLKFKNLT